MSRIKKFLLTAAIIFVKALMLLALKTSKVGIVFRLPVYIVAFGILNRIWKK